MTDFIILSIIAALASYLLGGINGAIILSRLVYHEDIRTKGSGNPGFTNFKRVHGFCPATFAAMAIDIFKTIIPVVTFMLLFGSSFENGGQFGAVFSLLFCMLGHCFPVWYKFKGGKAVLAYLSGIWFVDWRMGLICFGIFVVILLTIKYMSLASMTFAFTSPIVLFFLGSTWQVLLTSAILSVLVIARHHQNIVRLCKGTESKFSLKSKKS
ncbi:MAG: glycerol-3-phosphate 1-O-acyltransferase PlsY [Ruminococcaceae bacterium]|nr:glycerol-3-phosphate 1-O-acyltransferase PlsY [Oscillospiraceae bacterium]